MSESTCRTCGTQFTPRSGGKPQVYCSKRCRQIAEIERAAEKRQVEADRPVSINCEVCSKEVLCKPVGRRPQYCSNACRIKGCTTPERKQRYNREFVERHPGYYAEKQREYREAEPDRSRQACRRYYASHSDQWDRYRSDRSHLFRSEDLDYTTWALVAARFAMWGGKCWMCGSGAEARDHVKPLSKGGRHLPVNIRPICHSCNSRKNARWPFPCSPAWPATFAGRRAFTVPATSAV